MGLDFSHTPAHWSYSGFNRARTRLARAVDIDLEKMEGFSGSTPWEGIDDPIVALLDHSDCDGDLTPEECRKVAPRLRELVAPWPDDDYDKQQFLLLAEGMDAAVAANEPLEFC